MLQKQPKNKKQPKCKVCHKSFDPHSSLQITCDYKCALIWTKKQTEKRQAKKLKEDRQRTREIKESLKTKGQHLKEAQIAFNGYVRERDKFQPCISHDEPERHERRNLLKVGGAYDCGHYRSVGSAPHLRFNLKNAHKQCKKCNNHLSGNVVEYRIRLIVRIGLENLEILESNYESKKFTIEYLKRIKRIFNKKKRIQMKRNELID